MDFPGPGHIGGGGPLHPFLYYYFGPTPAEFWAAPKSSAKTEKVSALIGGKQFLVPENYLATPRSAAAARSPHSCACAAAGL